MNLREYKQIADEVGYGWWIISVAIDVETLFNRCSFIDVMLYNTYVNVRRWNRCICEIGI